MFVLHPVQQTHNAFLNETDLAGPLLFCLMFGAILLAVSDVRVMLFDWQYLINNELIVAANHRDNCRI